MQGQGLKMWNNKRNSVRAVGHDNRPYNKALHQTRRRGVPASRAVVEGRLAGEGWCWAGVWVRAA